MLTNHWDYSMEREHDHVWPMGWVRRGGEESKENNRIIIWINYCPHLIIPDCCGFFPQ